MVDPVRQDSDVFEVLMVCTANICRSPGAERLLALELSQRDLSDALRIRIRSAGVRGWDASPMDPGAAAALEGLGGMAEGFSSRSLTDAIVNDASLILTATKEHRSELVERFPRALRRTFTMKEFAHLVSKHPREYESAREMVAEAYWHRGGAEITDFDVVDPYGGTTEQHQVAMAEIHECMKVLADALSRCTYP